MKMLSSRANAKCIFAILRKSIGKTPLQLCRCRLALRPGLGPTMAPPKQPGSHLLQRSPWTATSDFHRHAGLGSLSQVHLSELGTSTILLYDRHRSTWHQVERALRIVSKHQSLIPGMLITSYEVSEDLRRGLAVPFRKRNAEELRNISELKGCDKGGIIFRPVPGVYERVARSTSPPSSSSTSPR